MLSTSLNLLFLRNLGKLWPAGRGKMLLPGSPAVTLALEQRWIGWSQEGALCLPNPWVEADFSCQPAID